MQGTFIPPDGTPPEIQEVFKYLALKDGMKHVHVPSPMTVEECQYGWKGVKERTSSSSQGGVYMIHWKAGHLDNYIASVHTDLANVPYTTGYSSSRW